MDLFDLEQVRHRLEARGLPAQAGPDGTLTLVPRLNGRAREDLLTTWGIDDHGHLYGELAQQEDDSGRFDFLVALATSTPCEKGDEAHVAGLIASLMHTKVQELARTHPAPEREMAFSA